MIDLKPACAGMIEVLRGIDDDRLVDPTPCDEYRVGDLVDHVSGVSAGFAALARRDPGEPAPAPTHRDAHWRTDVAALVAALGESWDDPRAWEGGTDVGIDLSNAQWGRIALTEMVVHGWDLAVATGQPFVLPPETLRVCHEHVAEFVPHAPVPELWGTAVDVPDDAPVLDRLLAVTGRDPAAVGYRSPT